MFIHYWDHILRSCKTCIQEPSTTYTLLSRFKTAQFFFVFIAVELIDLYYSVQEYQFYLPWRDFLYLLYNVGKEESIKQNRTILLHKNGAVNFSNSFHTSFIKKRKEDKLGHQLCFQMVRDIFNLKPVFCQFWR